MFVNGNVHLVKYTFTNITPFYIELLLILRHSTSLAMRQFPSSRYVCVGGVSHLFNVNSFLIVWGNLRYIRHAKP